MTGRQERDEQAITGLEDKRHPEQEEAAAGDGQQLRLSLEDVCSSGFSFTRGLGICFGVLAFRKVTTVI